MSLKFNSAFGVYFMQMLASSWCFSQHVLRLLINGEWANLPQLMPTIIFINISPFMIDPF